MRLVPLLALLCCLSAARAAPFADSHIHYNWDQAEIISAAEANRWRTLSVA